MLLLLVFPVLMAFLFVLFYHSLKLEIFRTTMFWSNFLSFTDSDLKFLFQVKQIFKEKGSIMLLSVFQCWLLKYGWTCESYFSWAAIETNLATSPNTSSKSKSWWFTDISEWSKLIFTEPQNGAWCGIYYHHFKKSRRKWICFDRKTFNCNL